VAVHLADWPGRGNGPLGGQPDRGHHTFAKASSALNKTTR